MHNQETTHFAQAYLERDAVELGYQHIEGIVAEHSGMIDDAAGGYYLACAEQIGDEAVTNNEIMARYNRMTEGYAWADFSERAFAERVAAWDPEVASLLKVQIGIMAVSTRTHLENMKTAAIKDINEQPSFAPEVIARFNDLASELTELFIDDLELLKTRSILHPSTYKDRRLVELENAVKTVKSGRAVDPPHSAEATISASQHAEIATGALQKVAA